jgi:hypothetical protein
MLEVRRGCALQHTTPALPAVFDQPSSLPWSQEIPQTRELAPKAKLAQFSPPSVINGQE